MKIKNRKNGSCKLFRFRSIPSILKLHIKFLFKSFDTSAFFNAFLFACKKRMALWTYLYPDLFLGWTCSKSVSAGTGYIYLLIFRMYILFHCLHLSLHTPKHDYSNYNYYIIAQLLFYRKILFWDPSQTPFILNVSGWRIGILRGHRSYCTSQDDGHVIPNTVRNLVFRSFANTIHTTHLRMTVMSFRTQWGISFL